MGRKKRIEFEGARYLISADFVKGRMLADPSEGVLLFRRVLGQMCDRFEMTVFACGVNQEKYNLLIKTSRSNLSMGMQWFSATFTKGFNSILGEKGSMFRGRFRSLVVENASIMKDASLRVHGEPSMLGNEDEGIWNSIECYRPEGNPPHWFDTGYLLSAVNGNDKPDLYYREVMRFSREESQAPMEIMAGICLGSEGFARDLEKIHQDDEKSELKKAAGNLCDMSRLISGAAKILGCSPGDLTGKSRRTVQGRLYRDLFGFVLYETAEYSNHEIGKVMGISASGVSHCVRKVRDGVNRDPNLKSMVRTLSMGLWNAPGGLSVGKSMAGNSLPCKNRRGNGGYSLHGTSPRVLRGEQTKSRLIDATLECLEEFGYHGTTLSRILERAGATRGGWQHHYKSKKDLVADAAETFYGRLFDQVYRAAARMSEMPDPLPAIFDFIWEYCHQGSQRNIWMELAVAARTDRELHRIIQPLMDWLMNVVDDLWRAHLETVDGEEVPVDMFMNLTLNLTRGMAVQSVLHDRSDYYDSLRELWLGILKSKVRLRKDGDFDSEAIVF